MEDNLIIKYLRDIDNEKQISQAEEIELARDFRNGNLDALQRLVKANLRFVIYIAKQYQYMGLSLSDVISEGNLGLIKAAERFDETKGYKFITYAVYWIRESIMQAIYENARLIRYPKNQILSGKKIRKSFEKIEQFNFFEPSDNSILSSFDSIIAMGTDVTMVEEQNIYPDIFFGSSEKDLFEMDSFSPDRFLLVDSMRDDLNRALSRLSRLESNVIERYYGLNDFFPHTLEEIGKEYNMTRERIRQIKESGLKKLKQKKFINILKQLFEESA